jgi:hypothetical protein
MGVWTPNYLDGSFVLGDAWAGISGAPVGWWRADTMGLSDNDRISTWSDSANSNDLVVTGGAQTRPTYKTGVINNLPVVRFDDTVDPQLLQMDWGATYPQPNTAFIVLKYAAVPDANPLIDGNTARNAILLNGGKFAIHATVSILQSSVAEDTNAHILTAQWNGASSIIRIDGTQSTGAGGAQGSDRITMGKDVKCDVAELIFYNGAESFTTNEQLLAAKYNITLA